VVGDLTLSVPRGWGGRIPLGRKVLLALGTLLALLTLTILLAVVLVNRLGSAEIRINDRNLPFATSVDAAALAAKGVANDERGYLISGDRRYLGEAEARMVQARKAFAAASGSAATEEERRAVAQAADSFETWAVRLQDEFATFPKDRAAAVRASLGETRELRKNDETDLAQAQALAVRSLRGENASIAGSAASSRNLLLWCLLAVLCAGLVIGWWMVRLVAAPVQRLLTLVSDLPLQDVLGTGSATGEDRSERPATYSEVVKAETERRRLAAKLPVLLAGEPGTRLLGENGVDGSAVVVTLADDTIDEVMLRVGGHPRSVVVATQLSDDADPRLLDGVAFLRATPAATPDGLVNPLGPSAKMAALWQLVTLDPAVRLVVHHPDGRLYRIEPLPLP
jgi:CHASE3 domain sensor protein